MAYLVTYRCERKMNKPTNQPYKTQSERLSRNVKIQEKGPQLSPASRPAFLFSPVKPDGYFWRPVSRVPYFQSRTSPQFCCKIANLGIQVSRGSSIGFYKPVIPTHIFVQSRKPDGYIRGSASCVPRPASTALLLIPNVAPILL